MAIPSIVQTASNQNAGGATTLDLTFSVTPTAGNLMLAAIAVRGGSGTTITPPTGWTLVRRIDNGTTVSLALYSRVNQSGAVQTYTWTFSSSQKASGGIREIAGIHPTTPIVAENGGTNASSTTHNTVAVSTLVADTLMIASFATATGTTATPKSGWTEGYVQATTGGSAGTRTTSEGQSIPFATITSTNGTVVWGTAAVGASHVAVIQGATSQSYTQSLALVSSATFVPTYASTFPSNTYGAGIYGSGIYGGTSATAGALTLTASGSSSALGQIRQTIGCSFIATSGFAPIPVRRVVTGLTLAANLNTLLGFKRALVMQTSLSASTTMGATALRLIKATSQLSGTSTLISVGQRKQVATSTFSATSTALFTVAGRKTAQLSLSASGTFGSLALRRVVGSVALTGASSSTLLPRKYIVSTFSGSSTSTSTFSVKRLLTLPLSLSGTASAATTPKKMLRGTATFSSLTQVAANPHRKVVGSFSSNFTSSLTATTQGISTAAVSFSSTLNSTILGRLQRTATLSFGSTSTFLSAPVRHLTKNVVFVSVGTLNAVAGVTVENSYGYAAFSAGSYGGFSTETFSESLNLLASTGFILSPMLHTTKGKLQGAPAIFRAEQVVPIALLREERGLPIAVFHEQQIPSAVQAIRGELSSPITAARAEQATPLAVMRTTQSAPIILLRTENTMPIVLTRQESLNTPAIIRNVIER